MDLIALHTPYSLVLWVVGIVGIFVMAIIFKDKGEATDNIQVNIEHKQEEIVRTERHLRFGSVAPDRHFGLG